MKNLHQFEDVKRNCAQLMCTVKAHKEKRAADVRTAAPKPPKLAYPDPITSDLYPYPAKVATWGHYVDRIYKKYAAIYGAFAVFIISSILMGIASVVLVGMATIGVVILAAVAGYHWWTYLDE